LPSWKAKNRRHKLIIQTEIAYWRQKMKHVSCAAAINRVNSWSVQICAHNSK
jgi:hypothetical protein